MEQRHVLVLVTPAYQPRLAGIARYARQHGWQLTIMDRLARRPRGWNGDGVLVTLREDPASVSFVKSLVRRRIPVVDLTYNHPEMHIPRVSGDHFEMGRLARRHFEERNIRHYAWFSTGWLNIHRLRYEGFASGGTRDAGEIPKFILSKDAPPSRIDDFEWFDRWLGENLRRMARPLGLLAYDDSDAARALGACLAAGLSVPEDVAIIGIGGDRLVCENQQVPITSVEHNQGRTGYEGAKLLDALMGGAKPPRRPILVPPRGVTVRASTDFTATASPILRAALEYMRRNLSRPFGLAQMASATGASRATLCRLFKSELGRTAGKEIARQRMAAAKKLLLDESLTVAEVAYRTGFCNPAYLTNTFRTMTGMSPREWRSIHLAESGEPV